MTSSFKNDRILLAALVVGLFSVESFFALWTGNPYDMEIWFQTGNWMSQGINIYMPPDHMGYPPLWAFWCLISYNAHGFFGGSLEIWRFIAKLPLILGQFALAFAVWKFASQRFDAKTAKKAALFTLTSSFIVYIGAFWGQINVLSALLTFLAFFAVTNKRVVVGGVLLGLAVALKTYPLIVLPPLFIYLLKNQNGKQAGKFLFYSIAVPVAFTLAVFAAYSWDITYLFKTMFYWAPVFDANPTQFQGGCMNIWSFAGLMGLDVSAVAFLRFLWIPILGAAAYYWWRKRGMTEADLSLSVISFYLLFMVSYVWVTEQTFLDPLPFILLSIIAYRPQRGYLLALAGIQVLVYLFSFFNGGPLIFEPLFAKFFPPLIAPAYDLQSLYSIPSWQIRGLIGLVISLSLAAFLFYLGEPDLRNRCQREAAKLRSRIFG